MTKRSEIEVKDQWDVSSLYSDFSAWEKDLARIRGEEGKGALFSSLIQFSGKLDQGPHVLFELLTAFFAMEREIMKIFIYAHLCHDTDLTHPTFREAYSRAELLFAEFKSATAWIKPEIFQLSEKTFLEYLQSSELSLFRAFLEQLFILKPHVLSSEKEAFLESMRPSLEAVGRAFTAFNNADLQFPKIKNEKGEWKTLTHASYGKYLESPDRVLREGAFKALHQAFDGFQHTLAELLQGKVQSFWVEAKTRRYTSCLHAALTPYQIDVAVYHQLLAAVEERIDLLHRYMKIRKTLLDVETLHCWDLHVPLFPDNGRRYSFEEAVSMLLEAVAPLGEEYGEALRLGLLKHRWVDRYPSKGKRSGAYSSGCYDSYPFILLNYEGTFRDVMTLAHEAGHSMHSFFSREKQPYVYADYSIFVAEVASTFNEELLFRYLLKKTEDPIEKKALINRRLDDLRATCFRQTQFAAFELLIHQLGEKGIPLTGPRMQEEYLRLQEKYYGPHLALDVEIGAECLRIPHFYSNFYVYQYATGVSAAYALCERVCEGDATDREAYLQFLSSGSSYPPLETLKKCGVDMCLPDPVNRLLSHFESLLDQVVD